MAKPVSKNKTAQDLQDDIFRKMSADEKVAVGASLWKLGKDLAGDKIDYGAKRPNRSKATPRKSS